LHDAVRVRSLSVLVRSLVGDLRSAIVDRRSLAVFITPTNVGGRADDAGVGASAFFVQSVRAFALRDAECRWFTPFIALHIVVCALHTTNVAVSIRVLVCTPALCVCTTQKVFRTSACAGGQSSSIACT
jgi:hypothetical protein